MISFYDPRDPYGFFSNFSRHIVRIYDRTWMTSEHAFQAMKFDPHRADLVELVWKAISPAKAAELGRDRSLPLRQDWDIAPGKMLLRIEGDVPNLNDGLSRPGVEAEPILSRVKDVVMYEVCYAKFTQHPDLQEALLDTGTQALVERALHDPYWGCGASMVGHNKLGRILMAIRQSLKTNTGRPLVLLAS